MKNAFVAACVLLTATVSIARAGDVILDETCYWRYHVTVSPVRVSRAKLESDGEKYLTAKGMETLQRRTQSVLDQAKRKGADWRDEVTIGYGYYGNGSADGMLRTLRTAPPPAEWPAADFDDGDWACKRLPYLVSQYIGSRVWTNEDLNMGAQQVCCRTTFEVPDPAAAGELALSLAYRGGVRVLLNGKEIARGHLPEGELPPDARAEDYSAEAYYFTDPEVKPVGGVKPVPAPELEGRYEDGQKSGEFARVGPLWATKAGWDRVTAARTRRLAVKIPAAEVRKGVNVLAVEVRAARPHPLALNWFSIWGANLSWLHAMLEDVELKAAGSAPSAIRRPAGVQVWTPEVHHRVYSADFAPPSARPVKAKIVGAPNGVFAAQLAVGTDRELRGLKAGVGKFTGPGGKELPAAMATVLWPVGHPAAELRQLGENRGSWGTDPYSDNCCTVLARYGTWLTDRRSEQMVKELKALRFFDDLAPSPPEAVPADSAQPIWISVKVPADAPAGRYTSQVTVSADGMQPVPVPLELEVAEWRVPDPLQFQTVVALEQSPYGVARHYKVPLWSEEHFRLIESSLRLLGQVGNDWWNVPIVCYTEFGNREDSPIRWKQTAGGEYELDFTRLGRYLDLIEKHCGRPMVVNFVINHPSMPGRDAIPPLYINVEKPDGASELVEITKLPEPRQQALWRALATKLHDYMKARGLERAMYWGFGWDGMSNPELVATMAGIVPQVRWAKGCHGAGPDETFTAVSTIYNGAILLTETSKLGWSRPEMFLYNPRHAGHALTCFGNAAPFAFRLLGDRSIVSGARGPARLGADYWDGVYMDGYKTGIYFIGLPGNFMFYPAEGEAHTSIRYEVLREGIQEAEARIFLEQALTGIADEKLKADLQSTLDEHNRQTMFVSPGSSYERLVEYSTGWQGRSARLYQAAATAAGKVGAIAAAARLTAEVPARGTATVVLPIRNASGQARKWSLTASQPWIRPTAASGMLPPGQGQVEVVLDATGLPSGKGAAGELAFADATGGAARKVPVVATVGEVFTVTGKGTTLNAAPGASDAKSFRLFNHSRKPLVWKASASAEWVTVSPAGGTLASASGCDVTITARPPGSELARLTATAIFHEEGGAERALPLEAYVLTPYLSPAGRPQGQGELIDKLPAGSVLAGQGQRLGTWIPYVRPEPARGIKVMVANDPGEYELGLSPSATSEIVCKIEGKGYTAFAAEVGPPTSWTRSNIIPLIKDERLHFEVYVDGRLAAHSGPMAHADKPRLLVVTGLEKAKEIRLLTRLSTGEGNRSGGVWIMPTLYR